MSTRRTATVTAASAIILFAIGALVMPAAGAKKEATSDRLWAVMDAGGSLIRGSGVRRVSGALGDYLVYFTRAVDDCAFTATIGAAVQPGLITVAQADEDGPGLGIYAVDGVHVTTYGVTGMVSARDFHLIVEC
jgi:hypothetical protein